MKGEHMSKIAVLIADMFEDSEYLEPVKAFKQAGHEVVHVGLEANGTVKGKKQRTEVRINMPVGRVSPDDFDALLIPGGYSPDKLRAHEEAVTFARDFVESGKPVFAICHAPQLLITADVLKGRKVTGWKSIIQDIKNAGAEFLDQQVVRDGNLISSRDPGDLPAFIGASLEMLEN
jgi:protease I